MRYGGQYDRLIRDWAGGRERDRRFSTTTDRFLGSGGGERGGGYDRSFGPGARAGYGGELSPRGRNRGARMGLRWGREEARGPGPRVGYGGDYADNVASARYDRAYFSPGPTYGLRDSRFSRGGYRR